VFLALRIQQSEELAKLRGELQRLRIELDNAENGPYVRVEECDEVYAKHRSLIAYLDLFGVRLFTDRHGEIAMAEIPDTSNFAEATRKLRTLPNLRVVAFRVGPLLTDVDWSSDRFKIAYAAAARRAVMRTFALSPEFREQAYQHVRENLPKALVDERLGAFW